MYEYTLEIIVLTSVWSYVNACHVQCQTNFVQFRYVWVIVNDYYFTHLVGCVIRGIDLLLLLREQLTKYIYSFFMAIILFSIISNYSVRWHYEIIR